MHIRTLCGSLLLLLFYVNPTYAGGLRTQLGEVVVENLQVGQTYSLTDLANLSLRVTNTSEYPVELRMEVLVPGESELKLGAGPIPDLSWIALSCDSFNLGIAEEAVSDIVITIPDEDRCLGKSFQFMVWSHTVPGSEGGMFLATGLKSRVIFTTDTVRADLSSDGATPSGNAGFTVLPSEIHLNAVPLGVRYDVAQTEATALVIKNPTAQELTLKLYSKTVRGSMASLEPSWEDTPEPGYLTFDNNEVMVPPHSERQVRLYLDIPDRDELKGKRLMFLVHVCDEGGQVTTAVLVRIFAALEK